MIYAPTPTPTFVDEVFDHLTALYALVGVALKSALWLEICPQREAIAPEQVSTPVAAPEHATTDDGQVDTEAPKPDHVLIENITHARQLITKCRLALYVRRDP